MNLRIPIQQNGMSARAREAQVYGRGEFSSPFWECAQEAERRGAWELARRDSLGYPHALHARQGE